MGGVDMKIYIVLYSLKSGDIDIALFDNYKEASDFHMNETTSFSLKSRILNEMMQ